MNNEEKILKLVENNDGIITSKEINNNNIETIFLTRLVNKGKLERVKKGVYILSSTWGDEYFNVIYGNNAVFSYDTALYFLNLCETIPREYHITVERNYNASLKHNNKVKLHFVKKEILDIGRITIKSPQGQMIDCYNAERCICDLVKDKNNQDIETFRYAITEYLKDKNKRDLPKLIEYAKIFNIEDEINKYLEVLM